MPSSFSFDKAESTPPSAHYYITNLLPEQIQIKLLGGIQVQKLNNSIVDFRFEDKVLRLISIHRLRQICHSLLSDSKYQKA